MQQQRQQQSSRLTSFWHDMEKSEYVSNMPRIPPHVEEIQDPERGAAAVIHNDANPRNFYFDGYASPEAVGSILQAVLQSNNITEFYFYHPDDEGDWWDNPDNVDALMDKIDQWETNPDCAVTTYGYAVVGINLHPPEWEVRSLLYSMASKMPRLAHLDVHIPAEYNLQGVPLRCIADLMARSETLQSVTITSEKVDVQQFLPLLADAFRDNANSILTEITIQHNFLSWGHKYEDASVVLEQVLAFLELHPQIRRFTVLNYNIRNNGLDPPYHPLLLTVESVCAKRRCKQLPADANDATKEDIYESIETAKNDSMVCPQAYYTEKHKLATITTVLYENVRNNNDAWVSIIPSLNFATTSK